MTAMPPDLRDKMLKLMGGCEHEPVMKDFLHLQCQKCYEFWLDGKTKDGNEPPTVGDGHEPTTDELLDLAKQRWGPTGVSIKFYFDEHGCSVDIYADGDNGTQVVDCFADPQPTPAIALATAIAEAVKGERG